VERVLNTGMSLSTDKMTKRPRRKKAFVNEGTHFRQRRDNNEPEKKGGWLDGQTVEGNKKIVIKMKTRAS